MALALYGRRAVRARVLNVASTGATSVFMNVIAAAAGWRDLTVWARPSTTFDVTTNSPRPRDAITDLYDSSWDKRAKGTRAQGGAATAARRRVIAGNWCVGVALGDDELDILGYRPTSCWKHATGTRIALDMHPSARPRRNRRK